MTINVHKTSCVAAISILRFAFILNISYLIWREFCDFVTQFGRVFKIHDVFRHDFVGF